MGAKIVMKILTSRARHLSRGRKKTLATRTRRTQARNQAKHTTNLTPCGTKSGSQVLHPYFSSATNPSLAETLPGSSLAPFVPIPRRVRAL